MTLYNGIMEWFEQRNIRRGDPETIIEEYENSQKKSLLTVGKRDKDSLSESLFENRSENFRH